MKVLVTGGAGYIGSQTCKELRQRGHEPVSVDNLVNGHDWAVCWGPLFIGDIRDKKFLKEVILQNQIQAIIHFAGFAYVGESFEKPIDYYMNNTVGTIVLAEVAIETKIDKVIFSSSCATYGIPREIPITESSQQSPINPYGSSKLMAEQILKEAANAHGLQVTALRYFNAGGADLEGQIGEYHEPETHLIPLALKAAYDGQFELKILGDDYPTKDGTCVRDYIHVCDLANAHVLALEKPNRENFEYFNLGSGQGFSVFEIISEVERVTGKKVKFKAAQRRPGDPPVLVAQAQKANKELNWSAKNSNLATIIQTANDWYQRKTYAKHP